MVCNVDSHALPEFIVTLVTNCGGVLSTVLSVASVITDTEMEESLRSIFLSFSIANVIGTAMLAYDTIVPICYHEEERLSFVMTISVMLSLSHLMLLIIDQHIMLTAQRKRVAKDFTGLIIISWLISITIGMMNVVSHQQARIIFAVMFVLIMLLLAASYITITTKHYRKKRLKRAYQLTFLRKNLHITKVVKKFWMHKFFTIIIISYACCSILWVVNELREGFQTNADNPFVHSTALILYSLNFYFPSAICIYLRCMQLMSRRGATLQRVQSSYRYRDVY